MSVANEKEAALILADAALRRAREYLVALDAQIRGITGSGESIVTKDLSLIATALEAIERITP